MFSGSIERDSGMKEDKGNMTIIRNHSIDLIESKRPNTMRLFKVKKKQKNQQQQKRNGKLSEIVKS